MTLYFRFQRLPCPRCKGEATRLIDGVLYKCCACDGYGTVDRMVREPDLDAFRRVVEETSAAFGGHTRRLMSGVIRRHEPWATIREMKINGVPLPGTGELYR